MAEIVWTLEAAEWLDAIYEYIARDNPSKAHSVVRGIYDKVQLLCVHPRLGQRYEPIANREIREVLYGHYRIVYLIKSDERIEILGIFHGALDIDRYLR